MFGLPGLPRAVPRAALTSLPLVPVRAPARAGAAAGHATTDLSVLRWRRLIALVDCENLAHEPVRDLWMDFRALARALNANARSAQLHAFYTEEVGRNTWGGYFHERGYACHAHPVEYVHGRLRANSDSDLLFHAVRLLPGCGADTLLVASGDGDLICDIARLARQCDRGITTVALGLPGKVSSRLQRSRHHVDHCVIANEDLLHRRMRPPGEVSMR